MNRAKRLFACLALLSIGLVTGCAETQKRPDNTPPVMTLSRPGNSGAAMSATSLSSPISVPMSPTSSAVNSPAYKNVQAASAPVPYMGGAQLTPAPGSAPVTTNSNPGQYMMGAQLQPQTPTTSLVTSTVVTNPSQFSLPPSALPSTMAQNTPAPLQMPTPQQMQPLKPGEQQMVEIETTEMRPVRVKKMVPVDQVPVQQTSSSLSLPPLQSTVMPPPTPLPPATSMPPLPNTLNTSTQPVAPVLPPLSNGPTILPDLDPSVTMPPVGPAPTSTPNVVTGRTTSAPAPAPVPTPAPPSGGFVELPATPLFGPQGR